MNRLTIALCLALGIADAFAGTIAVAKNQSGGVIAFTDSNCNGEGKLVYIAEESGKVTLAGCYAPNQDDGNVIVKWNDGDVFLYPYSALVLTPYGESLGGGE